ncbi:NfeD family protein [Chelatococcus sp. SYSU_G07232]|uniref:NfeD family protein n=1 Tax=Chelatococcus albus TaxID=3047466 RepID=A0ABT7AGW9_9HYPH|nr:NfeD family protein [Chelatococcus sp. SYSU_G07232]MDJ1158320.1 NfeD family protein [Chelatococcus sp. SYSU_G07232]
MITWLLHEHGPWMWIVLGLALMGLELLAPGVFFLWLGLAAVVTGVLDALLDLSWQASALLFAVLAAASVGLGRILTRRRGEEGADQPFLNRRGAALVGETFTLDAPIEKGEGRLRVGDSVWRIVGPDCPAGATVRVLRIDGATLVVERA